MKSYLLKACFALFLLCCNVCHGQLLKLRSAHDAYKDMAYPKAIELYEDLLANTELNAQQNQEVLSNLARAYKNLLDFKNADFVYKDLFAKYENKLKPEDVLAYAQVLAGMDRKRESQKMYSKYGEMQKDDLRAKRFSVAYMDLDEFHKDSSLYKIKFMEGLNTNFPDFSPMYYQNGLVFVSGRKESVGIKRIFSQNDTPFLDLFWAKTTEKQVEDPLAQLGAGEHSEGEEVPIFKDDAFSQENTEEFSTAINSKYHEGPFTFFKGYRKMIFTRNSTKKNKDGVQQLKLYMATKKGAKWGDIAEVPFNSNEYSCGHPALSPDNRRLYFASDMPGGYGGTDLYVIDYKDGVWGTPMNLGKAVNTEGNELFPFADAMGDMYFASNGHAGLGGLDIFKIPFRDGLPYGEVQNLGAPINSEKDDFGLIADRQGANGFFSSNRKNGSSDDNIYAFEKGCKTLDILVYDNEFQTPLADVELRSSKDGVNGASYMTNSEGKVSVCLESGHDFSFKTEKEGYRTGNISYATLSNSFTKRQEIKLLLDPSLRPLVKGKVISEVSQEPIPGATVTLKNDKDGSENQVITGLDGFYSFQPVKDGTYTVSAVKEFHASETEKLGELKKKYGKNTVNKNFGMIAEGDIFGLDNIYFDRDKSVIRADAKKELDQIVIPLLQKYPGLQIELRAHTDSRSSEVYNQLLSEERALAVVRYLVGKGVRHSQLKSSGVGEQELVNDCGDTEDCNDKLHQKNRRTEFKVLSVGGQLLTSK
jgi:outer membrane protein OmpA-like peptidoglycan-associated protein